jgi:DNA invertase Pin-like site-specific DNA recombinase
VDASLRRYVYNRDMRVAFYCRVSTKDRGQDTANQLRQLKAFAAKQNWTVVRIYEEKVSGKKGEQDRQQLQQMFADARKHKWDCLLFWSLDRLSRQGALPTMKYLSRLSELGIGYRSFTEEYVSTMGVFGDVIISLLATLAKQEAIRVSERTKAGLERARAQGRVGGRPRASITVEQVHRLHREGMSLTAIGKQLGAGKSTVHRLLHGMTSKGAKRG